MTTARRITFQSHSGIPTKAHLDLRIPWEDDEADDMVRIAGLKMEDGAEVICWLGHRKGYRARMLHVHGVPVGPYQIISGELVVAPPADPVTDLTVSPPDPVIGIAIDGVDYWPDGYLWRTKEAHPGRTMLECVQRIGGYVVTHRCVIWPGSLRVAYRLNLIWSDSATTDMRKNIDSVALLCKPGVVPVINDHYERGGGTASVDSDGIITLPLFTAGVEDPNAWHGDAQGWAWRGSLMLYLEGVHGDPLQELLSWTQGPVHAVSDGWDGHHGPFGVLPEIHPTWQGKARMDQSAIEENAAHMRYQSGIWGRGTLWRDPPYGCQTYPGQSGAQEDFAAVKGASAVHGYPSGIETRWHSVLWDAFTRPVHMREPNGQMVRLEDHPNSKYLTERIHYHPNVSTDRLGKIGWVKWRANGPDGLEMIGHDDQHASWHNLCVMAEMTGDEMLLEAIRDHNEAFLFSHFPTGGHGVTRSLRMEHMAAWGWMLTKDDRILDRFTENIVNYKAQADAIARGDALVAVSTMLDKRLIPGPQDWWKEEGATMWVSWEMCLSIGMDAMVQVLRMAGRHEAGIEWEAIYWGCIKSWIKGGWRKINGRWTLVKAVRWNGGKEIPEEWYEDGSTMVAYSAAFDMWAQGLLRIAQRYATKFEDAETLARAREIEAHFNGWWLAGKSVGFEDPWPMWAAT